MSVTVSDQQLLKHAAHFHAVRLAMEDLPAGPEKAALVMAFHRWHVVLGNDLTAAGVNVTTLSGGTDK